MRLLWLSGTLLCMVICGCQSHKDTGIKKHPWQSWGNKETFLIQANPEVFWALSDVTVRLKSEAWPHLTQLLESNDFIPVSEEWVKEFAAEEIPPGADPWYLVRGLSYGNWGWYAIHFFPETGILYVYTATLSFETFALGFDYTAKAAPVAVRLPAPPRRVFCSAICDDNYTWVMHTHDPDELPQIQWRSQK